MSALPESLPAAVRSRWLTPGVVTAAVLLGLVAAFWPTLHSMIEIWERSETFTHGYLIFPISVWLIWRQRAELAPIQPATDLRGLLLLAVAGAAWLLGHAGSVNVVAQYGFVGMLIAVVWTLLGVSFARAVFFPLAFLLFAVPVGEFLIEPLMEFTADFTVFMLQVTGIPVYREGLFFSIPSGDWSVVEACSGLRYLIASITLGVLYAYLTYRSWKRRLLFTLAALVVPILANGGRAYMIVMIGHLSDMKYAVGVDHLIYGWVFFGFVMLLLFWIGSFWREDDRPQVSPATAANAQGMGAPRPLAVAVAATLAVALVWPAYAAWLSSRPLPSMPALQVQAQGGWQPVEAFTDWAPHWVGADRQVRQAYAEAGHRVMLELNYYVTQRQDAELVNSQNFMIRQKDLLWSNVGEGVARVEIGGVSRAVRQAKLRGASGQRLLVWQWNLVNGVPVASDHRAKWMLALDRVRMRRDDGLSVLIATPYEETELDAASDTLARFAADMESAIAATLDGVDGE
ncbi:MAG: exosortase A [Pseudomonadota bacterium]